MHKPKKRFPKSPLISACFFLALFAFCLENTPLFSQTFEGFWEQKALVTSQLPVLGKKVEKEDHRIFVTSWFLKTVDLNDGRTNIFDYRKQKLFRIDPAQQTVSEITFSDFEALMKRNWEKIEYANKRFREKLKNMDPQQRQMAILFLGGDPETPFNFHPKIQMRKYPDQKRIAGFTCTHLEVLADGRSFWDGYWTEDIRLPRAPVEIFRQFGYFPFDLPPKLRHFKGFPMETKIDIQLGVARVFSTATVTRVVPKKISLTEFHIPDNFRKVPWNYMKLF